MKLTVNKKNIKKIFIIFFLFLSILFPKILLAAGAADDPNITLQVPLLNYTKAKDIGEYIKYLYKATLYIVIPFIIVVIIYSGILWIIASGDRQLISKAKERIKYSLIGLAIALFSYILLSFVGITELRTPEVEYIPEEEAGDTEDPLYNGPAWNNPTPTTSIFEQPITNDDNLYDLEGKLFIHTAEAASQLNINCPKNLKNPTIPQLAQYFVGKITYRMGGKGGPPPYADVFKCENNVPCKTFCPPGQLCYDCSGFANLVLACAGRKWIDSGTKGQFGCGCASTERIKTFTATAINGKELKPGDLVGYPKCGKTFGHVYLYVGGGKLYESHGTKGVENPESGRIAGKGIRVTNLNQHDWLGMGHPTCVRRWE